MSPLTMNGKPGTTARWRLQGVLEKPLAKEVSRGQRRDPESQKGGDNAVGSVVPGLAYSFCLLSWDLPPFFPVLRFEMSFSVSAVGIRKVQDSPRPFQ